MTAGISPAALAQLDGLLRHYEQLGRIEAAENLLAALEQARDEIAQAPSAGLTAPRPYPDLASFGFRWVKSGRYWVAYTLTKPPVIAALFHDTADIPGRI